MKVMQILYSGLGGHGSVAFSLHNAAVAAASDWQESMMFVGIEPVLEIYERRCQEDAIPYRPVRSREGRPWRSWAAVYRGLCVERPDVLLLHSVKLFLPCWWYAWRHGAVLIGVEHQANALKSRSEWMVSRLLMRLAHGVVVLTREYREELNKAMGRAFRGNKVHVVPNGIDVECFAPRDHGTEEEEPVRALGMAARFTPGKCQKVLVEAVEKLRTFHPGMDWQLWLAGEGETLESVKALVEERGLEKTVVFSGHLEEQDLPDWYRSLDIYVHASKGETLSTSLLQAMATGLPVVASDVPGISNLLGGAEQYGLLVEDNTPEAFARTLALLAGDEDLRMELSWRARKHVVCNYSHKIMFQKYQQVISACRKSFT
ncbi:glycosyltransferase family 4 protein [Thiolapillus sp.]